jgi:CheY-like chemotaxis protein
MPSASPVVAVVNTNPDLLEVLKHRLEQAGLLVIVLHIKDLKEGMDFETVLRQHDPRVIVYDLVFPYERNWRFMDHLRTATAFKGRQFVLTTPNLHSVQTIVGTDETVYEILGDDADLDAVVQAVREASRARPTR